MTDSDANPVFEAISECIRSALINTAKEARDHVSMPDFISILTYEYARLLYIVSDHARIPLEPLMATHLNNLAMTLVIGANMRNPEIDMDKFRAGITAEFVKISAMNKEQVDAYVRSISLV